MRKLPTDYPIIYDQFKKGKFVVKTNTRFFRAFGADMKLEKTIQRSKKGSGGIIGQTKQEAFVIEWELVYHEVLAISKCHKEITGSQLANSDVDLTHRELTARSIVEYNEAASKVINFMKEKGNPYLISANTKLHHFTSGPIVQESTAEKLIDYFDHGQKKYESFRRDRFITKTKKVGMVCFPFNLTGALLYTLISNLNVYIFCS